MRQVDRETIEKENEVKQKSLEETRKILIGYRDECFGNFDADGLVILSHAIRWLSFKIEGKPYERESD